MISTEDILSTARDVLIREADAVVKLSQSLGEAFPRAVTLLHTGCLERGTVPGGRVIVSGMGKSGHIAKKITATFASTGQPAFFVHPAEASHGDLGMITAQDRLLLISNGGETAEMQPIIHYAKRFKIPVVGITSRAGSTLARMSDAALILPDAPEVCPMGLAPTTSTTMTLALGDALAVCMMRLNGFTPADFHCFHPGGNLGRQLAQVRAFMQTGARVPLIAEGETMADCIIEMTRFGLGCIGITGKNGSLAGIITDGDLRRHMHEGLLSLKAEEVMTRAPVTISPDTLMAEALALMQERKITSLFVIEDEKPAGILHIHDCLRAGIA